jgi:hypothetical protein
MSATVQLSNFFLSTANLQIAVWTTKSSEGDIIGSSAMPVTITGSNQFATNQSGTGPSLTTSGRYTLHVQFAITSGNWSTFSTDTRLVAQFVD